MQEDPDAPLTSNTAQDSGAAWTPDGSRIAFERSSEIWVMNSDGSKETRLTNNAVIDSNPTWSPYLPDGSIRIAFHRNGDVWTVNPADLTKTQITNEPTGSDSFPNWSPKGTRIVFQSNRNTAAFPNPPPPLTLPRTPPETRKSTP